MTPPDRPFDTTARHSMVGVGAAFLIWLGGCITYAAGGSVLWAWGGLVIFAAVALAAAILLALLAHEAQKTLTALEAKPPAGVLRRVLVTIGTSNPPPEPEPAADMAHLHPLAVRGYQLLAHADLAVNLNLEDRRGKVEKYRYGRTDEIGVDVVVVKVSPPR